MTNQTSKYWLGILAIGCFIGGSYAAMYMSTLLFDGREPTPQTNTTQVTGVLVTDNTNELGPEEGTNLIAAIRTIEEDAVLIEDGTTLYLCIGHSKCSVGDTVMVRGISDPAIYQFSGKPTVVFRNARITLLRR